MGIGASLGKQKPGSFGKTQVPADVHSNRTDKQPLPRMVAKCSHRRSLAAGPAAEERRQVEQGNV
jgi:hypothetical protein